MDLQLEQPQSASDWTEIRRVCCMTGSPGGRPIEKERWPFFGELWVGPYEKLTPEWAWVLRGEEGQVSGYLTASPETRGFSRRKRWLHELPLVFQVLARRYKPNDDTRKFLARFLGRTKAPEALFSRTSAGILDREYPAHLHINLDESLRGRRLGDRLIATLCSELSRNRIPGVHLICGQGPVPFYRRVGFQVLEQVPLNEQASLYLMVKKVE